MNPRGFIKPLRRATLVLAIGMGLWMVWRFDRLRLPEEGCSPLASIAPGDLLMVDRHPGTPDIGDALFVEFGERVHLVRLKRRDPKGLLWVETEVDDCPGEDSNSFGWLDPEAVVGRVLIAWS